GTPGDVEADGLDRAPAPAELDALGIGEALVLWQLPPMERLDAIARECQRVQGRRVAGLNGGGDLIPADAQAFRLQVEAVEFSGRLEQRRVAAFGDVVDNRPRGRLDVGRDLALGGEELRKSRVEIGAGAVEANGHGADVRRIRWLLQWRGGMAPST